MIEELNETENKSRDVIKVDSALIDDILILIEEKADQSLNNIIKDLHHADIAEIVNHLSFDEGVYLFRLLDTETSSDVVTELDEDLREKILNEFNIEELVNIIDELDTDDATDIVSELPENIQEQILEAIDLEDSKDVKKLLKYDEESAGGIMNSDFVFVYENATVQDAVNEVRKNADDYEHIYQVYVLQKDKTLLGSVSLKSLIINSHDIKISEIMEEDLIYVPAEIDQEEVANIIKKYDLVVIPVVDGNKHMIGRITIDDVVDVMDEEASEDIQKMAGLSDEQESSHSIFTISKIRLPWLIVSLFMELVNALLLSSHQAVIEKFVITTFFIPIVMAMGGSSGTQAAIVMVRGLSTGEIFLKGTFRQLGKELGVAILNGIILGTVLLITTYLFWPHGDVPLSFALVLASTLLIVIIFATMVGAIVPVVLLKLGVDPAIATGPFVSTTNDIVGMLIYFSIISLFLNI